MNRFSRLTDTLMDAFTPSRPRVLESRIKDIDSVIEELDDHLKRLRSLYTATNFTNGEVFEVYLGLLEQTVRVRENRDKMVALLDEYHQSARAADAMFNH